MRDHGAVCSCIPLVATKLPDAASADAQLVKRLGDPQQPGQTVRCLVGHAVEVWSR